MSAGRLLPLFSQEDTPGEDNQAEAEDAAATKANKPTPQEEADATWWLVRCFDGRVPRHEELPVESGKSVEASNAAKEGTVAVLARIAEDFDGQPLVRD